MVTNNAKKMVSENDVLDELRYVSDQRHLRPRCGNKSHSVQVQDAMEHLSIEDFSNRSDTWKLNLKNIRYRCGLSQADVAALIHRPRSRISDLENPKKNVSIDFFYLEAFCLIYGCMPQEFLDPAGCLIPVVFKREGSSIWYQNIIMNQLYDPESFLKSRALHMVSLIGRMTNNTWEKFFTAFVKNPSLVSVLDIDLMSNSNIHNNTWLNIEIPPLEYSDESCYAAAYAYHEAFWITQQLAVNTSPRLKIMAQLACADQYLWYDAYCLLHSGFLNGHNALVPWELVLDPISKVPLTDYTPKCFKISCQE